MMMVYILLAAFQRKQPALVHTPLDLRAPHTHRTQGAEPQTTAGSCLLTPPWSEAGPTFLGAPHCSRAPSARAALGRGRRCSPGVRHSAQRGGAGASQRGADNVLCWGNPAVSRAPSAVSARSRETPPTVAAGSPRGVASASLRGRPTSDENRV